MRLEIGKEYIGLGLNSGSSQASRQGRQTHLEVVEI